MINPGVDLFTAEAAALAEMPPHRRFAAAVHSSAEAAVGCRCLERQQRFALPPFDHGPSKNLVRRIRETAYL